MYKVSVITRIEEGASWEDVLNGDAYETAYIVTDEETGEIIMDTTNKKLAYNYLDRVSEFYEDLALEQQEQM